MLLRLMSLIGKFYYWTWFIWPFVFVFSFAYGLSTIIKNREEATASIFIASLSLLIILAGITSTHLGL